METYDFGIVRDKFDTLTEARSNKLEREWPGSIRQHPGSRALVLGLYPGAYNTFRAARFLLADLPPNPGPNLSTPLPYPP